MSDSRLSDTFSRLMGRKNTKLSGAPKSDFIELMERPCKRLNGDMAVPLILENSIVERLPPELYMYLAQNMNPVEAVLLNLTCKTLWAQVKLHSGDVLRKLKRSISRDQTLHFLQMLEKDSTRYIVCTVCLSLHYRKKKESILVNISTYSDSGRRCNGRLGAVIMRHDAPDSLYVHREAVELVLRAAALGPEHGPSLDILKSSRTWDVFSDTHFKVKFRSDGVIWRGKDDDDRLLLKTEYSFEVDLRLPVSEQISASSVQACQHDDHKQLRFVVKAIEHPKSPLKSGKSERFRGCAYCPTDMLVQVARIPDEKFATVEFSVFRDVGPRGDHRSKTWQAQSYTLLGSGGFQTPAPFDRTAGYPFGMTKLDML